jgi:spore germination cell wall hydrolase CwlJ-like protein
MNKIIFMAVVFSLLTPLTVTANINNEIDCLAKNIYYEARGESFEGKQAVAQVTINRANHSQFPSSVCGVVHQKNKSTCQFSWVCSPRRAIKTSSQTWLDSKRIAELFLTEGHYYDTIGSQALFYHEKHLPFNWNHKYKKVATIGNHIFYRKKECQQRMKCVSSV